MRRLWIYRVAPGLPRHTWRREREQVFGETGGSKHDSRSRSPTWDQRIHSTRNESPRYGKGCRTDHKSLQGRRTEQRAQSRDKTAERVQDSRIHLTSKSSNEVVASPFSSLSMVSFDVDGTIFRKAALTQAARSLGIGEKWDALDQMYHHQRITLRECLASEYKLLQGMKLADVLREVSKVEVIRNVRETVEKLQGHGIRVVLLTDNPDFLCAYLIERFGFEGYVGSKVGIKDEQSQAKLKRYPTRDLVCENIAHGHGFLYPGVLM